MIAPTRASAAARSPRMSWPSTRIVPDGRLGEAEQEADQGRLAGAVGAEEAERGAARHLEVDAVERRPLAEALAEPAGLDGQGVGVHGTNVRAPSRPLFGRQDEPVPLPHPIG